MDTDKVNYCVSSSMVTLGSQAPVGHQLSLVSVLQTVRSVDYFLFSLFVSPAPSLLYKQNRLSPLQTHLAAGRTGSGALAVAVFHMGTCHRSDPGCAVFVLDNNRHPWNYEGGRLLGSWMCSS